jgi:hypothetical protein
LNGPTDQALGKTRQVRESRLHPSEIAIARVIILLFFVFNFVRPKLDAALTQLLP